MDNKMRNESNLPLLLSIFTPRELYDMQLQYHAEVCRQPKNYYTAKNIILEKLGGLPVEKEVAYDE